MKSPGGEEVNGEDPISEVVDGPSLRKLQAYLFDSFLISIQYHHLSVAIRKKTHCWVVRNVMR